MLGKKKSNTYKEVFLTGDRHVRDRQQTWHEQQTRTKLFTCYL